MLFYQASDPYEDLELENYLKSQFWGFKVAQQGKAPAAKPDDPEPTKQERAVSRKLFSDFHKHPVALGPPQTPM